VLDPATRCTAQLEAAHRKARLCGQLTEGAQQPLSGTRCATTTDHVGSRGVGGGHTPDSHRAAVRRHRSPRGQQGEEGGPQAAAENWRTATPVTGAGRGGQRGGSRVSWGMDSHRKAACATATVVGRMGGRWGGFTSRPVQYGRFGGSRTGLFDPNRGFSTPPVPTD